MLFPSASSLLRETVGKSIPLMGAWSHNQPLTTHLSTPCWSKRPVCKISEANTLSRTNNSILWIRAIGNAWDSPPLHWRLQRHRRNPEPQANRLRTCASFARKCLVCRNRHLAPNFDFTISPSRPAPPTFPPLSYRVQQQSHIRPQNSFSLVAFALAFLQLLFEHLCRQLSSLIPLSYVYTLFCRCAYPFTAA